ncbi:MAG: Gfo/Idh/MocA family oxidoreductase [Phycisphaerae bacterium]|nr:Gfo/Idh/MocA family oxidoreductase [Phycisphaerae bacterium]
MYRVAIIGCGAVAESGHLPALMRHSQFHAVALCDTRLERAKRLAGQAGAAATYTDWRALLDGEAVDAAVLALPPEVSPDVAIACLERSIPVLDEKPLASTIEDGRRMAHTITRCGGVFQVGFVLRYGACVEMIRQLARKIGTPARYHVAIYDEKLDRADTEHFTRIQGFLRDSSAMTHEGSHVIDYAVLWNSSPWKRIRATATRTEDDLAGPNVWQASVDLADSSTLEIEIGWLLPELPPCTVSVEGPDGRVELSLSTGRGSWWIAGASGALALPPMAPEWDRQYDVFAEAIEYGEARVATVADGLRALEVSTACERSARTGEAIVCDERNSAAMPREDSE